MNKLQQVSLLFLLLILQVCCSGRKSEGAAKLSSTRSTDEMQFISGGSFQMGSDSSKYPAEGPVHSVAVKDFYIDKTEVTNLEFKEFIDSTGYTTTAEIAPTWEELKAQLPPGTPPPDDSLKAGSVVFFKPENPVTSMEDFSQWWRWVEGADWKHPEGPASNLENRWNHPVVHISLMDAQAYCSWKGKRLPTEAEWEYAARGGEEGMPFSWGTEFQPKGKFMANTYQGGFPMRNLVLDGFEGTAPVKSFPANKFGLYDMIGNVWEWTADLYDVDYYASLKGKLSNNPAGSNKSFDPQEPFAKKYVIRGGSYLCAGNYCSNYRNSARQAAAFDSGTSNVGFRCVKDIE